jgi:predicted secreted Zn-dependent protease
MHASDKESFAAAQKTLWDRRDFRLDFRKGRQSSAMRRKVLRRVQVAVVAALSIALSAPGLAEGKLAHTTDYRSHPVQGATLFQIWRYMNAHPIIDPDDGPAYANLTHDHTLSIKTKVAGGACKVSDLNFQWSFVLTLPKAADYGQMSAGDRATWDSLVANFKRHEEGHRKIFLDCGKDFVPAATKLTGPNCAALEKKVRQFIDKRYAACMAKQREYEKIDRPKVMASPFFKAAMAGK